VTRFVPLSLAVAVALVSTLAAAESPPGKLQLTTERVVAFKDGYCLIIKRGTAATDEKGQLYLDEVPDAAVLGSFWAVPEEGRLASMVAGRHEEKTQIEKAAACLSTIELLLANKGRQAKVELNDKRVVSGVIHEVLVERKTIAATGERVPDAAALTSEHFVALAASAPPAPREALHTTSAVSGNYFVLRSDDGDVLLPAEQVRALTVKDMQTTLPRTIKTTRRSKRLTFSFDEPRQERTLTVMYFRPGVRWIPTYRIQLAAEGAKRAEIALQAELLNEAEDFKDVLIDIVVGVPNFRFRQTPSPLALESVLRNALAQAEPNLMGQIQMSNSFSNAMFTQRAGEFRRAVPAAGDEGEAVAIDLPDELTAAGAQDLFVYHLPQLSLAKGERAAIPIFTAPAPYRDVYTWDVRIKRSDIEAAPSGSDAVSPLVLSTNEVWHQVELTNRSDVPWTTGAAMLLEGHQPLAQELLTYTPTKNAVRLPVTVSVETRGSFTEEETGRDLNALVWDRTNYARIEKLAQLRLTNNKPVAIDTEITVRLGGKATAASDEGRITLGAFNQADWNEYRGHPAVNNSSTITWRLKLQPGETFEPTVTYHYFTRH
jgi:hypothetical protein